MVVKMINMERFLKESGLAIDAGAMKLYADDFDKEMIRGLHGEDSSLMMLPTFIPYEGSADGGSGAAIVIDAGGTNLRIALVQLGGAAPEIKYFEKYPIPGFKTSVTAEEFFGKLAEYIEPIAAESDKIGFCFSNPAEILPNRDARIIKFTKEVKVAGASGVIIGDALRSALKGRGLPHSKHIVVLNDTVATQLGAMADVSERGKYSGYIGMILGTGLNASYTEKNGNIHKAPLIHGTPGATLINIEAGGYRGFPRGEVDAKFIEATIDPGIHWLEKMTAGAYQCSLLLKWIRFADDHGCFSRGFSERLAALAAIPVGEADRFYFRDEGPTPGGDALSKLCAEPADAQKLGLLIQAFFERISFMIASMLTGIMFRMNENAPAPQLPVCISVEGSTFYNARLLRPALEAYMREHTEKQFGLHYHFVKIEHATILGSALAGLAGN
ncbi:MAG: hexokinase [Clostridiales Family XIII bacterium]|nr:hexokinase [Clostridiales Family XIII bacterium]